MKNSNIGIIIGLIAISCGIFGALFQATRFAGFCVVILGVYLVGISYDRDSSTNGSRLITKYYSTRIDEVERKLKKKKRRQGKNRIIQYQCAQCGASLREGDIDQLNSEQNLVCNYCKTKM